MKKILIILNSVFLISVNSNAQTILKTIENKIESQLEESIPDHYEYNLKTIETEIEDDCIWVIGTFNYRIILFDGSEGSLVSRAFVAKVKRLLDDVRVVELIYEYKIFGLNLITPEFDGWKSTIDGSLYKKD